MHLLDADVRFPVGKHLVHLLCDSLRGDFVLKSISDPWVSGGLIDFFRDLKVKSVGKADRSQHSEGVVHKGLEWFKRSSANFRLEVIYALSGQIFNLSRIDVVEK